MSPALECDAAAAKERRKLKKAKKRAEREAQELPQSNNSPSLQGHEQEQGVQCTTKRSKSKSKAERSQMRLQLSPGDGAAAASKEEATVLPQQSDVSRSVATCTAEDAIKEKKNKKKKQKQQGQEEKASLPIDGGSEQTEGQLPRHAGNGHDAQVGDGERDGGSADGASGSDSKWGSAQEVQAVGEGMSTTWPARLVDFQALSGAADPRLLEALSAFERPSPIQGMCWPVLLPALALRQQQNHQDKTPQGEMQGPKELKKRARDAGSVLEAARDLIGIAATGSGKTLAFGIPALQHALSQKAEGGSAGKKHKGARGAEGANAPAPSVLVLAPTRELAQQISGVLEEAGQRCGVGCVCLFGGAPKGAQKAALRKNPGVVVATPGRLEDLAGEGALSLHAVTFAVLDEADRMLDLGFEPHIRSILAQTSTERRTVMLSATWPTSVAKLASDFLSNPIHVTVGSASAQSAAASANGGAPTANRNVKQIVEVVDPRAKDSRLLSLLQQYHKSRKNRVLVFALYKKEAQRVETFLSSRGWAVGALHGDKNQSDRTRAVASFKSAQVPLLVATDVAARGLDIPDVECVINYTFPLTIEDYVHRIGRTGRAGKTGTAHTFFTAAEKPRAGELVNVLREAGQSVPEDLLKFGTTVKKKESKLYGAHFREITADATKPTKVTFADSDEE